MGKHTDFIYLSEPETIKAGVLDAAACVDTIEESFRLLSEGDYLMGGPNHNNHGITMVFPKESPFPNMPLDGPDRRFAAMPAYVGGRFDVCGCKWYGSNAANATKGLPRSVLVMLLNDKDTGEPLCMMSANLISAARTGAVPGVATRHLANPDAEICSVIGCGPINKACIAAIRTQMKNVKKFVCFDLFIEKAEAFADWVKNDLGVDAVASSDLAKAVSEGDVVSVAASRLKPLYLEESWLKKGSLLMLTGPAKGEDGVFTNSKIILDHVKLQEAYVEDAIASGNKEAYYAGVIGGPIFSLIDKGALPALNDFTAIGDIIRGVRPGRTSHDERVLFITCGMAVYDVAWTYDIYQNALKEGIGTKLLLWDSPAQA
ncbi:MAG: ornithine cyclodeaminase [Lachnospiraceae bacterium]|jgi:ornithine cyclodeaminase|nr:ornithine cyclodeaminase [Lachnospiraceae bacterium]